MTTGTDGRRPTLSIVGVGPGSPDFVTPKAVEAIRAAEVVVGWDLDLLPIKPWLEGKQVFLQNVKNYQQVIHRVVSLARRSKKSVAVARVGDPCISSGLKELLSIFRDFDISIVPGISSVQMVAAVAGVNLDEAALFSFHDFGDQGQRSLALVEAFRQRRHLVVLASPDLTPNRMAQFLMKQGVSGKTRVVVCSNLTLPKERILDSALAQVARRKFHWLTISVVVNPAVGTERQDRRQWQQWRRRQSQNIRSTP